MPLKQTTLKFAAVLATVFGIDVLSRIDIKGKKLAAALKCTGELDCGQATELMVEHLVLYLRIFRCGPVLFAVV